MHETKNITSTVESYNCIVAEVMLSYLKIFQCRKLINLTCMNLSNAMLCLSIPFIMQDVNTNSMIMINCT